MPVHTRVDIPDPPPYPLPVEQVVIEVVVDARHPGSRLVLQDGVESSYIDIANPSRLGFEYQRHLANVIDVLHPRRRALRALQIGGGPCAVPRYLEATRRDLQVTVVELDAGVVDVAKRYLGLRESERLAIVIGDGRDALAAAAPASHEVVIVDAFLGLVVPHRLVTTQFTELARSALTADGMHIVNLIDIPPFGFATAVAATLAEQYANVLAMGYPQVMAGDSAGNVVLVATDRDVRQEIVARRAARDRSPWSVMGGRALRRWIAGAGPLDDDVRPTHDLALLGELFGRSRRTSGETPA